MTKFSLPKLFLYTLFLVLLLASGCGGSKSPQEAAQLPEGFAAAMVPSMPLDGYFFARQSQPTGLSGKLLGLPFDVSIQSVAIWLVPGEPDEIVGAVLTLATPQEAETLFAVLPARQNLWKYLAGNNIFAVMGTGNGAVELRNAIEARKFVPLATASPDAWDLIQRFPGQAAPKPAAMGFIVPEDRLMAFLQKNSREVSDPGFASALKIAGIKMLAVAFYSNKVLQVTDFLSPATLKEAGVGGTVIAKSSYPGLVIFTALGTAASKLSLEKTSLDGKTTYYRAIDAPGGEKLHLLVNSSGSYIYASAAADLKRAQQLQHWGLGMD